VDGEVRLVAGCQSLVDGWQLTKRGRAASLQTQPNGRSQTSFKSFAQRMKAVTLRQNYFALICGDKNEQLISRASQSPRSIWAPFPNLVALLVAGIGANRPSALVGKFSSN
jgi:hypothetical protein